jgi:hypothetical protein
VTVWALSRLVEFPPPIKLLDMEDFLCGLCMAKFERYMVVYDVVQCTSGPHKECIRLQTVAGIALVHKKKIFPGSAPKLFTRSRSGGPQVLSRTPQRVDEYGWGAQADGRAGTGERRERNIHI